MKSDCDWQVTAASTKFDSMNRRLLVATIAALGSFPVAPRQALAAAQWQYRIRKGGFDGKIHHLGFELTLGKGWKTYWRVPGDGGVPPTLTMTGENIASVNFLLPAPTRYRDQSGESIGYKETVIFAIEVEATDPAKPVTGKLDGFLGVCEKVCIPVQFSEQLTLSPTDAALQAGWRNQIPQVSAGPFPVISATATENPLGLAVSLAAPVADIFIEPMDGLPLYFRQPLFIASKSEAAIEVAGAKSIADLRDRKMRFTSVTQTMALEQVIAVV